MAEPHPLDRPIWSSLTSGWAPLAEGDGRALRLKPDYGPFAASADGSGAALASLACLMPENGELWLVEATEVTIPPELRAERRPLIHQMVAAEFKPKHRPIDALELGDEDAAEMQALAALTKPGPFRKLTHRLGGFVGIRHQGKLIAMAGERMRTPGFCEVSGVCTHPDHRGRGLAGALMSLVAGRIVARGETPFLHTYADNAGAIALYESLGFGYRTPINLTVLTERADQGSSRLASP